MTTVYVNNARMSETDVYHARPGHATLTPSWCDPPVKEVSRETAIENGLRPCKRCYPDPDGEYCPGCGRPGEAFTAARLRCGHDDCRVELFSDGGEP